MSGPSRFIERLPRCSVVVAEDLGVLEKHAFVPHALKLLTGGKVVFAPILFRAARRARSP